MPSGASLNPVIGAFSWTPVDADASTYLVTFEVTDGYLSNSEAVTITVNDDNHAPVITAFTPLVGSVFYEGANITIGVPASDAHSQTLSYIIEINGVTQSTASSYAWETDYSSAGAHNIDIIVSNGTYQVTERHIINIYEVHPRWDVNQDGIVNIQDLTVTSYYFGEIVA